MMTAKNPIHATNKLEPHVPDPNPEPTPVSGSFRLADLTRAAAAASPQPARRPRD
jgi:hypothetical protein